MRFPGILGRSGIAGRSNRRALVAAVAVGCLTVGFIAAPMAAAGTPNPSTSFLSQFTKVSTIASTVPANGDENPYGIAVVPKTVGMLVAGDTLVSNFNNSANLQGLGTTIM